MTKLTVFALLILICLTGCHKVEPGYAGLKVSVSGSDRGDIEVLSPGRYMISPTVNYYDFPTFTVTAVYEDEDAFVFQSSEGMKVEADIGVSYYFDEDQITHLFTTYRLGADEIRDVVVKNAVRDSFNKVGSKYITDEIIGEKKETLIQEVFEDVSTKLAPDGIIIRTVSWYNPPRPPESINAALNAKVEANQNAIKAENEVAISEAEAEKEKIKIDTEAYKVTAAAEAEAEAIKIRAQAEAEANRIIAESLTTELIEYNRVQRWDGANPKIVSGTNSAIIVDSTGE